MNKKNNLEKIEELTKNEISALEASDKLARLEKESLKNKKMIAEFKEREKSSARALVLYERKIKYLKQVFAAEIIAVSESLGEQGEIQHKFREVFDEDELELTEILTELSNAENKLKQMAERLQTVAAISKSDRDFILNKQSQVPANESIEDRFNRLKQEFSQKIGSSVSRKRGRPKRGEQSIVADIGLGKKFKKNDDNDKIEEKFNELFYVAPTENVGGSTSAIPQTEDSLFDFNEALNPNISLKDIMADIMSESEEETLDFAKEHNQQKENFADQNYDMAKKLEAGIIVKPIIQKKQATKTSSASAQKKLEFNKHFLSFKNIVDDD